jgi:hypothetical protein
MAVSRGGRRTKAAIATPKGTAKDTDNKGNAGQLEGTMAEQTTNGDTKAGKMELAQKPEAKSAPAKHEIQLSKAGQVADRFVAPDDMEIAETYSEAGIRPIGVSHLEVFGTILNGRPISASHLHVMEYAPGQRPVFANEVSYREDLTLPGGRPVITSDPHLMEASSLPGGRPIASNAIDDSENLMGFLD